MRKKLFCFIAVVCFCVTCIVACTEPHEHDYTTVTVDATCTENGKITYTCECGESYEDEIPALGHDEESHEAKAATCTEVGWEEYVTCKREGCNYTTYEELPISGKHDVYTNFCIDCGLFECTQGLTCTLKSDGTYELTDIGTCTATDIVVGIYENANVTSIADYAFRNSVLIKSIKIEDCVKTIGDSAFLFCSALEEITIPDSVTEIGEEAFSSCSSLKNITIGNGLKTVGKNAFRSCSNLENVYIKDLTAWCEISFLDTAVDTITNPLFYADNLYLNDELVTNLVVPDGVKNVGTYAFYKYKNLVSVVIPDSVISIGACAFYNCDNLQTVKIGRGLKAVGMMAFGECDKLAEVYIDDITTWCDITFADFGATPMCCAEKFYVNNENVTTIEIPSTVTKIGSFGFYGFDELIWITIPDSVTSIGEDAFSFCRSLVSITIPDSVTELESDFAYCSALKTVVIGDGVQKLEDYSFYECESLNTVVIGNGVKSMGTYVFAYCEEILSVVLGSGVTEIGERCFYDSHIAKLFYAGTMNDWANINIADNNTALRSATRYYYSETEPELNNAGTDYYGNYWHYAGKNPVIWVYQKKN